MNEHERPQLLLKTSSVERRRNAFEIFDSEHGQEGRPERPVSLTPTLIFEVSNERTNSHFGCGHAAHERRAEAPPERGAAEDLSEIEVARAHGDLRENAEYHAAKEKQGHIEGRIMDLNGWIQHAEVIEIDKLKGDKIVFGATVELLDLESDKKVTYTILGEFEADLKKRRISSKSPVAQGLLGQANRRHRGHSEPRRSA